jgi:hypothetical protein
MAREPIPIPDEFMPKTVPSRGLTSVALDQLEDEIAEHVNTIKATTTQEPEPMQDRPAPAPAAPVSAYAPPPPRPVSTAIQNMPGPQSPASQMEIQFNGRTLRVNSTCNTDVEATQLIGALTALVPFLTKASATE